MSIEAPSAPMTAAVRENVAYNATSVTAASCQTSHDEVHAARCAATYSLAFAPVRPGARNSAITTMAIACTMAHVYAIAARLVIRVRWVQGRRQEAAAASAAGSRHRCIRTAPSRDTARPYPAAQRLR